MRKHCALFVLFALAAGCGQGVIDPLGMNASDDWAATGLETAVNIDVLANDRAAAAAGWTVDVTRAPLSGDAFVEEDRTITYTPGLNFVGHDSFQYTVTSGAGAVGTANVTVEVSCGGCAAGISLTLMWDPNPPEQNVQGYIVFFGGSPEQASELITDLGVTTEGFDPQSPAVQYDAWKDLGLYEGDHVCFRLKAYNEHGQSDFSEAACATLTRKSPISSLSF